MPLRENLKKIKDELWQGSTERALELIACATSEEFDIRKEFCTWTDNNGNGLICAALHKPDALPLLDALLDAGCDPDSRCGGSHPISVLIDEGAEHSLSFVEEVATLLRRGANPNVSGLAGAGMTVLHHAVDRRRYSIVELLLLHGGDPDVDLEGDGDTARKCAVNNLTIIALFDKYGK
jgi:ankyrin repeat protein